MIVARRPSALDHWRPLLMPVGLLLVWDIGVTVAYFLDQRHIGGIDIQFTLFGTAIALFIGFMVNAAYARWWEARTLWGSIVNSSRSLGRQAVALIDEAPSTPGADPRAGLRDEVVRTQVAYVHVLRTALRGQELPAEAETYLDPPVLDAVQRVANRQTACLTHLDQLLTEARRRGMLGEFDRIQMEQTLVALTDAQGGLERINNTPLPVQYRFLPRFFARLFCVILPFAVVADLGWATPLGSGLIGLMFLFAVQVGDDLADPFVDGVYDVPMTAITRTIEIDLIQMIGDPAPAPVKPVQAVLW